MDAVSSSPPQVTSRKGSNGTLRSFASFRSDTSSNLMDKFKASKERAKHAVDQFRKGSNSSSEQSLDLSAGGIVFRVPLREAVIHSRLDLQPQQGEGAARYWLPAVVLRALEYLDAVGLEEEGLYRISGSTAAVQELKVKFDDGLDVDIVESPPDDIHTVSSLLKLYLRDLPDPIIPFASHERIASITKSNSKRKEPPHEVEELLSTLPPYNYYLLRSLSFHLSNVAAHSKLNRMDVTNLGLIFVPTLRIDRILFNWLIESWVMCWEMSFSAEIDALVEQRTFSVDV